MAGRFITFEGLDGSGKSTHLARLAERLAAAGVDVVTTHEPGGTPLGDALRALFLDHRWGRIDGGVELLLMFASRRQHLQELVEPALERGAVVLCDRFTDSTLAYQGYGRGVPLEQIHALDQLATAGRRPHRTLLFALPAEQARQRGHSPARRGKGAADRLDAEELGFYRRVQHGFESLAGAEPQRFRVIDSSGPLEATERQVGEALADLLPELSGGAPAGGGR